MKWPWWVVLLLVAVVVLAGCEVGNPVPAPATAIESFTVTPNPVIPDGTLTLSWRAVNVGLFEGAPYCTLQRTLASSAPDAAVQVDCDDTITVTAPSEEMTMTYRLSALKRDGATYVTRDVTIRVFPTIGDILVADGRFDTLVEALNEAGLIGLFDDGNGGPFAFFAPTDAAFGEMLGDLGLTVAELFASPDLHDILAYHVVEDALSSTDVLAAIVAGGGTARLQSLLGLSVNVEVIGGDVVLDRTATITTVDLEAANGIIHAIDYVLLPPTP
jgi:uncharacterized surface protein with fasciclin (FAS1) repeats